MTVHRPSSKLGGTRGGDSASAKEKKLHTQKKRREPSSTYRTSDDHENAPTTSTRLCIKNIPGNFTSRQLRDYLIQEYRQRCKRNDADELVITDCHVLMHSQNHSNHKLKGKSRRIAFVGFQSPQMATNVKDKFHQTFALTSKLTVEYARTYQPSVTKEEEKSKDTKFKEKGLEQQKETNKNKNKQVTTTATKAKFWSNDLDLPVIAGGEDQEDAMQSDEMKSKKVAEEDDDDNSTASNSSSGSSSSDSSDDEADPLRSSTDDKKKETGGGGMSDLDFLKSKQTMVDNLDVDKDNAEADDDDDSSTSSSDSDSDSDDDDDDKSSSSFAPGAEAEFPSKQQENEDSKQKPPRDDMAGDDNANDMDEDEDEPTTSVDQNRLFVRNIPFATTEQELQDYFAQHGSIQECHIPVDDQKMSKGFGYITYDNSNDAARALQEMDGTDFQGRFLHVMLSRKQPQSQQQDQSLNDDDEPQRALSYKERQELIRRKKETANGTATAGAKGWSASFVRGDAVVDSLADRLGIKKGDILNVKEGLSSGDAAVRLALGETQIIEENRQYFQDHGIDMEALVSFSTTSNNKADNNRAATAIKRSTTSLLVKNLPYDTQVEELNKIFHGASGPGGSSGPKRILLPPSRTIALVEYGHSSDAKRAFRKLAYRRFKSVPLYLEWAPIQALLSGLEGDDNKEKSTSSSSKQTAEEEQPTTTNDEDDELPAVEGPTPSVYVKNLNFATTESKLQKFFEDAVGDVRAVTIPKKVAPIKKQVGNNNNDAAPEMQSLSMGFGFVEFASHDAARKAITKLQGKFVDGHSLELKPSTKSITNQQQVKTSSNKKNPTKITVRNVPFQASRTEILKLFGSFGQLKRVRLPKKFNGGHRGFAFVEFVTHKEAVAAMKALSRTHLYGRHLVLEWAEDETTDSSSGGGNSVSAASMVALREKAQRDVSAAGSSSDTGRQANKRQKFQ